MTGILSATFLSKVLKRSASGTALLQLSPPRIYVDSNFPSVSCDLVNLYLPGGEEVGQKLLKEGFARRWQPGKRNDWCG